MGYAIVPQTPLYVSIGNSKLEALNKKDIIQQKIVALWAHYGSMGEEDWLDTADIWLELENGHTVSIPLSGSGVFRTETLPAKAKRIDPMPKKNTFARLVDKLFSRLESRDDWIPISGQRIVAVYSELFEGEVDDQVSAVIVLSDGRALTHTLVAPQGTGAADLQVHEFSDYHGDEAISLVPFFTE